MTMLRKPVVVAQSILALVCLASTSCRRGGDGLACDGLAGVWEISLRAPSGYRVTGTVVFEPRPSVDLTYVSADGGREPVSFAADRDSLVVRGDSIALQLGAIGDRVTGRCVSADSIAAIFVFPQPPYGPIRGDGYLRRTR
jgi:hypothetical protein